MPEEMDALRPAEKAGSVDDIRAAVEDRLEQIRIVSRVILKIRILHQQDIAGSLLEAPAQSRSFSLVLFLKEEAHAIEAKPSPPGGSLDVRLAIGLPRVQVTQKL